MKAKKEKLRSLHRLNRGLCTFAILLLAAPAQNTKAAEVPEHYTPVRPLGMGGAFTAVANDENSIWTNPAGMARIRKARSKKNTTFLTLPNVSVGANAGATTFYKALKSSEDVAETVANSNVSSEKPFWASASAAPALFFAPGGTPMAASVFTNTRMKIIPKEDSSTESDIRTISDVGGLFGFAATSKSNRINAGVQARYINRYSVESTVETASLKESSTLQARLLDLSNQTTALAIDAGAMYTMADFWFPTVGFSVLNAPLGCQDDYLNPFSKQRQKICGTKFSGTILNPDDLAVIDPTDVRVGFSITPRFSRSLAMRVAVDMQHIALGTSSAYYGLPGMETLKMLHAGGEIFTGNPLTPSPLSFRFGIGQGFVSYGASVRISTLSLEFASYGRDISDSAKASEDRRYLGNLSLEF